MCIFFIINNKVKYFVVINWRMGQDVTPVYKKKSRNS